MNEPDATENQKKYPSLATLGRYRGRLNHERKLAEQCLDRLVAERPSPEAEPYVVQCPTGKAANDAPEFDPGTNKPKCTTITSTDPSLTFLHTQIQESLAR